MLVLVGWLERARTLLVTAAYICTTPTLLAYQRHLIWNLGPCACVRVLKNPSTQADTGGTEHDVVRQVNRPTGGLRLGRRQENRVSCR
jgi:hypothetical protein